MKPAKKNGKATKHQPFDHAADLPAAYQGLRELLRDLAREDHYAHLWDWKHLAKRDVRSVSPSVLLDDAAELEAIAARLREAAGRVHRAIYGTFWVWGKPARTGG